MPSLVVYLSGCDMRCSFCIAGENAIDANRGVELTPGYFAQILADGRARGAKYLQWSGGQPSIYLPTLLQRMALADDLLPVVWKSNFHETSQAMELLQGVVEVYLADCKFGNNACAQRLAATSDYFETLTRNLLVAAGSGARLICRHLLLPGHRDCCFRPIVRWLAEHLPGTQLSIRGSYLPPDVILEARELNAAVTRDEAADAISWARSLGLEVIQ